MVNTAVYDFVRASSPIETEDAITKTIEESK